jgi:hypothetical protein
MNISPIKPNIVQPGFKPRRVFAALLLATLAVAVLAGSALAATTNLVKNGSFEKDSNGDGLPNKWVYGDNIVPGDKRVCNKSHAGACSFKMLGTPYKWLQQDILISGTASDEFDLSAWTRGKNIVYGISGVTRMAVEFRLSSSQVNVIQFDFSAAGSTPWTLREIFSVQATGSFDSIRLYLVIQAEEGKFWFDQVKLVAAP